MLLKIFTSIVSVIAITQLSAQPVIKVSRTVGGANGTDNLLCMLKTTDGGFIAGGNSNSSMSGNKTDSVRGTPGYFDYWVVKYNANGKIQMDKTFGGNKEDDLAAVIQTSDGGYIIAGSSSSGIYADKTDTSRGGFDYWIIKSNTSGTVMWNKTYGGSEDDHLTCVQQTSDGGYILGGLSFSNISGEKSQNRNGGSYDVWLVKIDANGAKQWDKTIGESYFDGCNSIFQTPDGGYMIGGSTENTFSGSSDYLMIKTDAAGNQQWKKLFGGNGFDDQDYLVKMITCADGGYLLAGYSDSPIGGTKSEPSRGGFDYWIVRVDANGNYIWNKTMGGSSDDENLTDVIQASDGSFIVSGYSSSGVSGDKTEPNRNVETLYTTADYWVIKVSASGNIVWDKTIGGGDDEICGAAAEIQNGLYVIGGYSGSNISGDKKQNTKSGLINEYDFWIVTLFDNNTSAQQNMTAAKKVVETFSVYPNPVKDVLHIQTTSKTSITITDVSGKIWLQKNITSNENINVAHLPAGSYYLKDVETGKQQKLLIIK